MAGMKFRIAHSSDPLLAGGSFYTILSYSPFLPISGTRSGKGAAPFAAERAEGHAVARRR